MNVGFWIENILKGESPFSAPEPIFRSSRSLRRMLTAKVRRQWHMGAAAATATGSLCSIIDDCGEYGQEVVTVQRIITREEAQQGCVVINVEDFSLSYGDRLSVTVYPPSIQPFTVLLHRHSPGCLDFGSAMDATVGPLQTRQCNTENIFNPEDLDVISVTFRWGFILNPPVAPCNAPPCGPYCVFFKVERPPAP